MRIHVEHVEQFDLARVEWLETKLGQHSLQKLRRSELRL